MALNVGDNDVFERNYMKAFESIASAFGEFVKYERDRGARDIGLHLTSPSGGSGEVVKPALAWFQLKGLKATTLSQEALESRDHVPISLKTKHLKYWLIQPGRTFLVLYVECIDEFLMLDLKEHLREKFGNELLRDTSENKTLHVPRVAILTEHSFRWILGRCEIDAWRELFVTDERKASIFRRDYEIIARARTAAERGVEMRVLFFDWITKGRGEVHFQERPLAAEPRDSGTQLGILGRPVLGTDQGWFNFREHWHKWFSVEGFAEFFPYVEILDSEDGVYDADDQEVVDEDLWGPEEIPLVLGERAVLGQNCADEYVLYEFRYGLNKLGLELAEWYDLLRAAGVVDPPPDGVYQTLFTGADGLAF